MIIFIGLLYLLGSLLIVDGVYLLFGLGWALIALGVFVIAAGWFTARGMAIAP